MTAKGVISGIIGFLLVGVLWVLYVIPWAYSTIYGLFDNPDLATFAGLVAGVGAAMFGVQLAIGLGILIAVGVDIALVYVKRK